MRARNALVDHVLAKLALRSMHLAVHGASRATRALVDLRGGLGDLSIERAVAYGPLAEQRLDVMRLRVPTGPLRVLLYLHGGGFQQLSRETHWWFSVQFARAGFVVLNADYRLAPQHRYPAAVEDARLAFEFAAERAEQLTGDAGKLAVAGESAGANLALCLAIGGAHVKPRAVVLFAGLLQVSHCARLYEAQALPRIARARIASMARDYAGLRVDDLPGVLVDPWLDPLLWIEQRPELARALPAIYASVGSRDPILSDTVRLGAALEAAGARHRVEVYPGEPHAFQGMPFLPSTRASWRSCLSYLERAMQDPARDHAIR